MSNSKEVASLKKELEALQKEIDGSKTPGSQASYGNESVGEALSLGPSAVASPEFGPGGTGASGALANAAVPAKEEDQPTQSKIRAASVDTANKAAGKEEGEETIAMKRDMSIPSLKLDDYEAESSTLESNSNDAMSDSSAVVVDAEDGEPGEASK